MGRFQDKVVVITGGAGNLGRAVAKGFYDDGACVAIVDRQRETVEKALGEVIPEGDCCLYVGGDLLDDESVANIAALVLGKFGRIDVLVNIAGGYSGGAPLHETSTKTWDFMLDLNAKTVFLMSRAVIPGMIAQEWGKIINVGARAALKGTAEMGPYIASKMAVIRLTETMANELKDYHVNVNCILPGTIDTPSNRTNMPDADASRWVAPESLANVILFLASDDAKDVHGAAVPVYGLS